MPDVEFHSAHREPPPYAAEPRPMPLPVRAVGTIVDQLAGPERLSWRRPLVMAAATWLLAEGLIDADAWVMLAGVFVAGDALPKALGALRK